MKQTVFSFLAITVICPAFAQPYPELESWMINTNGLTGSHYVQNNSTVIVDSYSANVQQVQYSADYVYVSSSGIPSYPIGPYLDGNPAQGTDNEHLFQIARNPVENTGTLTETPLGPIAILINGVPVYDYKDAASYSLSTGTDQMGGPMAGSGGDGVWNRNAILAENDGFDCVKGHPSPIFSGGGPGGTLAGGTYHHHQNPTAFDLDLVVLSDICDMYASDGLYSIVETEHSPLIGFAFDGFPIYGAYGYDNPNGTGGIARIESSYQKRNITARTHYADGSDVTDGPAVSEEFPLGWYREDFEFVASSGHLDEHNGRFCVTPEYPNGTYAYFATVDENWNSAYPYVVGPTYYGVVNTANFSGVTITESVTNYNPSTSIASVATNELKVSVYPNPTMDLVSVQVNGIVRSNLNITVLDMQGKEVATGTLKQGSTIWYLDTRTMYDGEYIIRIGDEVVKRVVVARS